MHERVLIIDDEANTCLDYRLSLSTEGYIVSEARTAAGALDLLADSSFAVAIIDFRLPDMDGLALLAKIRQCGISIPAVFVSGFGDVSLAVNAMKLGAIDFLEKPLRPADLRKVVAEVLRRYPQIEESEVDTFRAYISAAKRCVHLQMLAKAKLYLAKALELNTRSSEAFNLAGVIAELLEDYDGAKKNYGRAITLDKNYEPAQQNMRRLFEVDHFGSSKEPVHLGD